MAAACKFLFNQTARVSSTVTSVFGALRWHGADVPADEVFNPSFFFSLYYRFILVTVQLAVRGRLFLNSSNGALFIYLGLVSGGCWGIRAGMLASNLYILLWAAFYYYFFFSSSPKMWWRSWKCAGHWSDESPAVEARSVWNRSAMMYAERRCVDDLQPRRVRATQAVQIRTGHQWHRVWQFCPSSRS